jgi:hypothetical protein
MFPFRLPMWVFKYFIGKSKVVMFVTATQEQTEKEEVECQE